MIIYLAVSTFTFWLSMSGAKKHGLRPRSVAGVLLVLALIWPITYLLMLLSCIFEIISPEEDINDHDD